MLFGRHGSGYGISLRIWALGFKVLGLRASGVRGLGVQGSAIMLQGLSSPNTA